MNSIHATVPSENWDDDFEFHQKTTATQKPENDHDYVEHRMSVASSDWDHEDDSTRSAPPISTILGDKKNVFNAEWVEPGPSTPTRRHAHAPSTENWDDDFEDSPVRKGFPSPPQKENSSPKASRLRRGTLTNAQRPESWDEEFDNAPSHASSPASSPGKRPRHATAYSSSEDEGGMEQGHDDDLDFGFQDRDEEDRTVTARSRRAALSRLSTGSHGAPPPPVPALPLPFLLNPGTSTSTPQPHPFPRSPTSSVFSVPTTTRPPSSFTVTSMTQLRPTVSRSSSGLGALPPSPPIHRERERRRLRKKSRPQGAGGIELGAVRLREREEYETGDELGDQDVAMRPRTPSPPVPGSAAQLPSGSNTPASGSGGGGAGALLSRIGSVKKWGVRRKRGSTTPGEVVALGKLDTDPPRQHVHYGETDQNLTPRPHSQASMSSVPSSSGSSNAHAQLPSKKRMSTPSPQANGNGSNWFFRSSSSSSNSQPSHNYNHTNSPLGAGGLSTPIKSRVASASAAGEGEQSPSKLMKRKSLGFVQLRRGMGGNGGGQDDDRERERDKEAHGKRRSSSQAPETPQKYGGLGLGRSTGGGSGAEVEGENEDMDIEHPHHERDISDEKEKDGARGFMGSVRRISLVGRHKRTKSGVSLSNVGGGTLPSFHPNSDSHTPPVPMTPQKSQSHHLPHPPSTSTTATPTPATTAGSSQSHSLLPPIELQPPSPPRVRPHASTISSGVPSPTTMPLESMLSPSTSSSSQTPSPTSNSPSASSIRPKAPGSPQAASLGRSTIGPGNTSTIGGSTGGSGGAGGSSGVGSGGTGIQRNNSGGGGTPVLRRNSLGDLKIPDRITQAQVALRRDIVMVREFAANVEQLKELQVTYHELVVAVQSILDMHAHQHAQQQQQQQQPQSRATSPSFFAHLARPMSRSRSNTNPNVSSTTASSGNLNPSASAPSSAIPITTHPDPQQAYKQLASAFYTINSKYRISWECAELLIELGNGNSENSKSTSSRPPSSISAPAMQSLGTDGARKSMSGGRERAITLAGDESKPPTPTPGATAPMGSMRGTSPPLASPPSLSWRASTGRHDLNPRQLGLLREMLNHGDSMSTFASEEFHHHHPAGVGGGGMNGSIPEESAFPALLRVNRDWRWGDVMGSTVTLPSEESGPGGVGEGDEGLAKKKKRRSSRLGMTGLRDMLRSLKKSHPDSHTSVPPIPASSTSLSTEPSSLDSHRYPHGHVPLTTGRRRAKTSSGPESMRLGRPTSPYSPSSLTTKPSPRRPSLASIFRLGQKNKPLSPTLTSDLPSDLQANLSAHPSSAGSHSGHEGSSSTGEEEDWDRVESASDLDVAARALGIGNDGSATVRGKGRSPYMQIPGRPLTPKRSANGSQSSLWGGDSSGGTSPPPLPPQARATRLSNVEEHADDGRQGRPPSVKESQYRTGASPSRYVHSPRIPKSGSVRSMPPQPVASAMPDPALAMSPENIKPLLENAREVHARLNECIAEIRALLATYLHPT